MTTPDEIEKREYALFHLPPRPPTAIEATASIHAFVNETAARIHQEQAEAQYQFIMETAGSEQFAQALQDAGWRLKVDEEFYNTDEKFRVRFRFAWVAPDEVPGVQSDD